MKVRSLFAAFIIFLLLGCQKREDPTPKVVKVNLGDEPHTMDPRRARDPNDQILMKLFFDGLTRIHEGDEPKLSVAKSIEVSADGKLYKITLKKTYWTSGDLVKASDFAYAWRSLLHPDFPSDNAYQLYLLKNAKEIKEGKLDPSQLGVRVLSDDQLEVELTHKAPYFLELLAAPFFFPIHQETDQINPHWASAQKSFVSNGPFALTLWHHHDQISARKHPNYWDAAAVQLEGVDLFMVENQTALHLFERGELHFAGSPLGILPIDALSELKTRHNLGAKPRAETSFLRVNVDDALLQDQKIRKALALAIDRKAIVEHVTRAGELVASRLVPPSMELKKAPYFGDGEKGEATRLFEEALLEQNLTRADFEALTYTYINSDRSHLIAQAIQDQWKGVLGISIELEAIERKVFFDRMAKRTYQMAFCSWGADFHDPINFLEVFQYRDQSTNNTGWHEPSYCELLEKAKSMIDPKERRSALKQCETILMEQMPIIPIFHYAMLYAQDKRLEGLVLSSMGNLDFKWAHLQSEE